MAPPLMAINVRKPLKFRFYMADRTPKYQHRGGCPRARHDPLNIN